MMTERYSSRKLWVMKRFVIASLVLLLLLPFVSPLYTRVSRLSPRSYLRLLCLYLRKSRIVMSVHLVLLLLLQLVITLLPARVTSPLSRRSTPPLPPFLPLLLRPRIHRVDLVCLEMSRRGNGAISLASSFSLLLLCLRLLLSLRRPPRLVCKIVE